METPPLAFIDWFALVMVAVGAVRGGMLGLSGELARLFSLVIVFFAGIYAQTPFAAWIERHTRLDSGAAGVLAFTLIVIGGAVFLFLLRLLLRRFVQVVFTPVLNRVGGVVAGALRAFLFVLIVFVAALISPHEYLQRVFGEESVLGTRVVRWLPAIQDGLERIRADESALPPLPEAPPGPVEPDA